MQEKSQTKLTEPGHVGTHDRGSIDTSDTLESSKESQIDSIKFTHAPSLIEEPLPPPELHWNLSLEEIKHQRALTRIDEIKRYIPLPLSSATKRHFQFHSLFFPSPSLLLFY